jgi:hypothetical protein
VEFGVSCALAVELESVSPEERLGSRPYRREEQS